MLKTTVSDKNDSIGSEDIGKKSIHLHDKHIWQFIDMFSKLSLKEKSNVFNLGDRAQLLLETDSIIIPQVAELNQIVGTNQIK